MKLLAILLATACTAISAFPSGAQDADTLTAKLVNVSCTADQVLAQLTAPTLPSGDPIGAEDSSMVAISFTAAPVTLEALVAQDTAIVIENEDGDILACGPVGGVVDATGSLALSLAEQNDSGVAGVAFLAPADGALNVSLFITGADEGLGQETTRPSNGSGTSLGATSAIASGDEQSGFSAEERQYAQEVSRIVGAMVDSLNRFSDLTSNPQVGNDVWSINVVTEIVTWQELNEEINALTPPPVFEEVHALAVEAFGLFVSAGDDIIYGFDNADPASINSATLKVQQASALFNQAEDLLDEIMAERGQ